VGGLEEVKQELHELVQVGELERFHVAGCSRHETLLMHLV
jgi:hypothetical protein